jgi:hypothetical protein
MTNFKEKFKSLIPVLKKYWWVILIIAVLGGMFYWFQWRPTSIRKSCYRVSVKNAQAAYKETNPNAEEGYVNFNTMDRFYIYCLQKNGLEK